MYKITTKVRTGTQTLLLLRSRHDHMQRPLPHVGPRGNSRRIRTMSSFGTGANGLFVTTEWAATRGQRVSGVCPHSLRTAEALPNTPLHAGSLSIPAITHFIYVLRS